MGSGQQTYMHYELLEEVKKRYEVYHINVLHSDQAIRADREWKELLGQNCISIQDHRDIPEVITKIICKKFKDKTFETPNLEGLDNVQML
jgi:hypothetical protein